MFYCFLIKFIVQLSFVKFWYVYTKFQEILNIVPDNTLYIYIYILRMLFSTFVPYKTNANFLFQIQWKFTIRYFNMRTTWFHLPNWYFSNIDKKSFVAIYTIIFLWSRCGPITFLNTFFRWMLLKCSNIFFFYFFQRDMEVNHIFLLYRSDKFCQMA